MAGPGVAGSSLPGHFSGLPGRLESICALGEGHIQWPLGWGQSRLQWLGDVPGWEKP